MDRTSATIIADALDNVATALNRLGNGDAATNMGAIENLAKEIKDGLSEVSIAIASHAESA